MSIWSEHVIQNRQVLNNFHLVNNDPQAWIILLSLNQQLLLSVRVNDDHRSGINNTEAGS